MTLISAMSPFRYWLDKQTPTELFVFVMYDTKGGDHARCKCDVLA
jgi:hypothetical protein